MSEETRKTAAAKQQRRDPYQEPTGCYRTAGWLLRLGLFLLVMMVCLVASMALYVRWLNSSQSGVLVQGGSAGLGVVERLYLQTQLARNAEALNEPAGVGDTAVAFSVTPGEGAATIAANLAAVNLLTNTDLFLNYLRFYGLDSRLSAGEFLLEPTLTIPELAQALTRPLPGAITLSFLAGWRLEEMAAYLEQTQPAQISASEFLDITQRRTPFDLSPYPFLAALPADASLEGFLFPGTYEVPPDADAAYLVAAMLANFDVQVSPQLRQALGAQGLTLREGLTLASIVHREAIVLEERPLIAGVYLNRLRSDTLLQADPTVQYAVGYQPERQSWWKNPLTLADLQTDSPYNTYRYGGLPPGPIGNPGLGSLEAVANPEPSNFIFFVANCDPENPGTHDFSVTYEEHLVKVERCR